MIDLEAERTFSVRELVSCLWSHLPQRRKRQFFLLTLLMILSALLEVSSLGAVIPFLTVLADPASVFQHPLGATLAGFLNVTSAEQLMGPLALIFATTASLSAAIRVMQLWANTRFSYAIGSDFSVDCFNKSLHQPFEIHLSRNSSEVYSIIAKKVGIAIAVLYQLITVISSSVITISIIAALILIDWKITLLAGGSFTIVYIFIVFSAKRTLIENSLTISKQEDRSIQILQEGLGGIRDVLLENAQESYKRKYAGVVYTLRQRQAINVTLSGSPRYLMEALGVCLIAGFAYASTLEGSQVTFINLIPALGGFALGAQRLLPTLQQIYGAWAGIVGNYGSVMDVIKMLEQPSPQNEGKSNSAQIIALRPQHVISLDGVRYRYTKDGPWVFDGLNLQIKKGSRIGIIGTTGSGKSTLLDILMALIRPADGELRIDDTVIVEKNRRAWQNCIAHVPQSIFLTDTSIASNIAFGVSEDCIDMERVRQAAQQARIEEFILDQPDRYLTRVGERGISLSGGQLQRIGLARALYKQASVLILDEATSALDDQTESEVLNEINQLDKSLTIIMVAHRLSTLKGCDSIVEIANSNAVLHNGYESLAREHHKFNGNRF